MSTKCPKCGATEINDISIGKKCAWCNGIMEREG